MLTRFIAIVSKTKKIGITELTAVAAALQKQATHDFEPIWGVQASVAAYGQRKQVPIDYWPIIITDRLDRSGAAGYHEDELGQPSALVLATNDWTVTASHEMLEMLADPWGRHLVAGQSPRNPDDKVKFLVEVCDPCPNTKYKVAGIEVSDFYTPHFFDGRRTSGISYSHTGAITEPRQVLEGGYLTWYDAKSRKWWHRAWFNGSKAKDAKIPIPPIVRGNIRQTIDGHIRDLRNKTDPQPRQRISRLRKP